LNGGAATALLSKGNYILDVPKRLPLLARRGGCAKKKIMRSNYMAQIRGGGSRPNNSPDPYDSALLE